MFLNSLAFGNDIPAILGVMIPIVIFMIPIVAILTRHQQRMAEIFHGQTQSSEMMELKREVAELKSILMSQIYAQQSSLSAMQSNQTGLSETRQIDPLTIR